MPLIYSPTQVEGLQFGETELGWLGSLDTLFRTDGQLTHLSNPASGDLVTRTQALSFTQFQMITLPEVISGLELTVRTRRNGRAVDEQIQLVFQGQPVGKNNFNYDPDEDGNLKVIDNAVYGSPTDTWGVELTQEMLQDPSFGVILKFQAHPYFPHRSNMILERVSLTVY